MGTGVFVKPGSANALDYGFGGGGLAGGGNPSSRPVTSGLRPVQPLRSMAPVGNRPRLPNSGARNLNGFNNRAPAPRGFGQQTAPKTTAARPFSGGGTGRGSRGSGFGELLRAAAPTRPQLRPARGFGPTAGNTPPRATPRTVPIDTPTPGAKRPFNFRAPLGNTSPGSLPGNPFAARPTPFAPSGADGITPPTYPNQLPTEALNPGVMLIPAQPGQPGVNWAANRGFQWHGTNGVPADRPGRITNPGIFFNQRTSDLIYATGYVEWENPPGVPGTPFVVLTNDAYWGHTDPFYNPAYNTPAYQTAPSPDTPPVYAPNPLRPRTPQPLPGADPAAAPTDAPAPDFAPPVQPAKQPLPYPSPDPAPLAPGDGPLPDGLTAPDRSPADPLKQPTAKPGKQPLQKGTSPRPTFSPDTAFATGVAIGRSLGATATAAINSTEAQAIKELLKNGIQLRTGEQRPVTTPVNGITGGKQIEPLIDIIKEEIPNAPAEKVNNCPPTGGSDCRYDSLNISGKCEQIKTILNENLDRNYSATVDFLPCEDDETPETISLSANNKGLIGIDEKLDILAEAMNMLWEKVKCDKTPLISITDSWEIKKELNTGQLVIVTKKPDDKTSYRRSFCIPHPRVTTQTEARAIFGTRRRYQRGNHLVTLILRDNSKIKLNVDEESTGQELMDWLVSNCLDLSYQETPPGQYRHTGNAGREIIECEVEIYSVAYYPTGKKGEMPDWQFVIPK